MIEDLKALLGLPEEIDGALENKLLLILKATKQRLRFLLGGLEPPEEMNYIILDVSIIRFNRIGSEGLSSHSVEGESLSWSENDFAGYMDDIRAYLDDQKESKKGKVTFLGDMTHQYTSTNSPLESMIRLLVITERTRYQKI